MKYIQTLLKKIQFQQLIGFTAMFTAVVAAYFSILGIGMLFSGAAISAMIMASAIELGKVVSVAFLYRYWTKCTKLLKYYLTIATFVLMAITSTGIFGWLSSAYQSSHIQYELANQRVLVLEEQKVDAQANVDYAKERVESLTNMRLDQEKRLTETTTNATLLRNPTQLRQIIQQNQELIASTDKDIREAGKKLEEAREGVVAISKEIGEMKSGNASGTKDIQTFSFVAEALGTDLNTVAKWFIISIILVFDPLAVALILAYNVSVYGGVGKAKVSLVEEKKVEEPETYHDENLLPPPVVVEEPKKSVAEIAPEPPKSKKKHFSEMSDGEKRGMSYDDIQQAQEEERRAKMPELYRGNDKA